MIDFHSHIIPAIDDGARELKEALEMLEEASSTGFDGVISTSHYMENYYEVSQADRKAWLNGLQYGLEEKKIIYNKTEYDNFLILEKVKNIENMQEFKEG